MAAMPSAEARTYNSRHLGSAPLRRLVKFFPLAVLISSIFSLIACGTPQDKGKQGGPNNPEAANSSTVGTRTPKAGCAAGGNSANHQQLLRRAPVFANPPVYDFTDGRPLVADLQVKYETPMLAGCKTHLRQFAGARYDGRAVGPMMLIKPAQKYQANIHNTLPRDPNTTLDIRMQHGKEEYRSFGGHGGDSTIFGYIPPEVTSVNHNVPGNFNVTNLHTHGWHVSPTENHDNIFAAIGPGDPVYLQQVDLPADHVAGTFWYHAHVHGSTTIQVASGMAGPLIVVDKSKGLDAIPEIASAVDRTMVLQQLAYDEQGEIEDYNNLQQQAYTTLNRPVFVNGQAYPVIQMRVGEVQRWRFIHAGITDGINPMLVSDPASAAPTPIKMHEIALDGIPTGELLAITNATLSPGYRVDVLAQIIDATVGQTYFLVDSGQTPMVKKAVNMRYILAQIKIVSGNASSRALPTAAQIVKARADYVYGGFRKASKDPYQNIGPLNDVADAELQTGKHQVVHFMATNTYTCPEAGGSCTPCPDNNKTCNEKRVYMTCDGKDTNNNWLCMNFNSSADFARSLALDTASSWEVSGELQQKNHTFHIHVNPFQVQRKFVDGSTGALGNQWVWKDTLKTPDVSPIPPVEPAILKSRYTVFPGAFVQHCHVLNHEDQGMMQVVEIRPANADLLENPKKAGEYLLRELQ